MSPDVLSAAQLSEENGVSVGTLANWRSAGIGPRFVKVGHRVRYRRADVEAWIAECTAASATGRRRDDGAA